MVTDGDKCEIELELWTREGQRIKTVDEAKEVIKTHVEQLEALHHTKSAATLSNVISDLISDQVSRVE